jgi:hypothetical protein
MEGAGAAIVGSAERFRVFASSGSLENSVAALAGSAAREREHFASGVLENPGATLEGGADRITPSPIKDSTGALSGSGAVASGSAERTGTNVEHTVIGEYINPDYWDDGYTIGTQLSGAGAQITGSAERISVVATTHDATGALSGPGAQVIAKAINGIARRVAGPRKNYIIQGRRLQLTDWELQLLLQQLMPKRSDVQIVEKKDVRQISRKLWKRLRETNAALESLTLERVDNIVQQSTIDYDEDDDLVMLLL